MWKQRTLLAAVSVSIAVAIPVVEPEPQAPRSIRLEFPGGVDLTALSVQYHLVGPFGGSLKSVRTQPAARTYELEVWQGGQPATTLKAIVYCPGRRFVLISESGFGNGPAKTVPIRLQALGSVLLAGRVQETRLPNLKLRVEVTYLAMWPHSFFGYWDGATPRFRVGSTELRADGSFSLHVPDFASDPVVTGHDAWQQGWLEFIAREPTTGNIAFYLRSVSSQLAGDGIDWIRIAKAYPRELQFEVVRRTARPNSALEPTAHR
jgi:hypothetical protein